MGQWKLSGHGGTVQGYHDVKFFETFGDFAYTMKARMEQIRILGPLLSPFNGFMLLQGIETLPVRMDRHCENALHVARFLKDHRLVKWVNYPGLEEDQYYLLAQKVPSQRRKCGFKFWNKRR